jgi:hypothetical protein
LEIQDGKLIINIIRKANIDKYINDSLRRKCYNEWVQVRRCAVKHMGDSFAMKINMTRQIDEGTDDEETMIENYKRYYDNKKFIHNYENVQGPPAEEEAAEEEGEGEGEGGEEEAAEEGTTEETSEEKTDEAAAGEEKSSDSTDSESASDDLRKVIEEETENLSGEHPEIKAAEESSDE